MSTQWRIGLGGPSGLCYDVLLALMGRLRLSDEEHEEMFDDIRVMEREALSVMNEKD